MRPIALIGAGGYVGARLIEQAELRAEFELVSIVRSSRSQGRLARYGVRTVRGDASDPASLVPLLRGCGMAVNLTNGDDKRIVGDVQSIHQACREAEVPLFVHTSSAEVFGRAEALDLKEDSVPDADHWMEYGRQKAAAEAWLRSQFNGPVKTVILRPGLIWGPGSGWLVGPAQALVDGTAYLFDEGRGICNLVHVDNLIRHFVQLARSEHVESGVFNVSDVETHSWAGYYGAIAQETGVDPSTILRLPEPDFREGWTQRLLALGKLPPAMAIKRRIADETKTRVKQNLRNWIHPPAREAEPIKQMPSIAKGLWWIQGTARKLPSNGFKEHYPELQLQEFPELMAAAGQWLRYAGFERTDSL
jgi:2-alkyl-3-oxoalkanoate reductase